MRVKFFLASIVSIGLAGAAVSAQAQQTGSGQETGAAQNSSQRGRGFGGFPGGGRGILGSVTEVAADHYTIRTDNGETYTVHFSVNTRILKQPAGQGGGRRGARSGSGSGSGGEDWDERGERAQPQTIKPTDIKVGDFITAGGEMDATAKSIGAVFIMQVDPERAKQMREMQANYGKTWLAGRITSIKDTTITIDGMVDHAPHSIVVDENTAFRQRRDSITLADIQPGEQLRAEGAVKGGVFVATTVTAMQPREGGQPGAAGAAAPQPQ
jgi:hypothetical protein